MADPYFGLELTFSAHLAAVRHPADAALLFVHWTLASSGLQAEHPTADTANQSRSSELLPPGWSDQEGVYEVTYVGRDRGRYLLKALVVEGQLIANMSKIDSDTTAVFNKQISEMVSDKLEDYSTIFKDVKPLKDEVMRTLLEAVVPGSRAQPAAQPSVTSQTTSRERPAAAHDPLRIPSLGRPDHPLAVGGADLDPLGRGIGGGMLMDPRRPPLGRLPPGVPPGARFDPFGPPDLVPRPGGGRRPPARVPGEPDPDHLRRPGFDSDNMFL